MPVGGAIIPIYAGEAHKHFGTVRSLMVISIVRADNLMPSGAQDPLHCTESAGSSTSPAYSWEGLCRKNISFLALPKFNFFLSPLSVLNQTMWSFYMQTSKQHLSKYLQIMMKMTILMIKTYKYQYQNITILGTIDSCEGTTNSDIGQPPVPDTFYLVSTG